MSFTDFLNRLHLPAFNVATPSKSRLNLDDLINAESALGRTIFGPIPAGHQREFFTAKKNVWIWHENWTDAVGNIKDLTIRYEVRPDGVFKKVGESGYKRINGAELDNFRKAAKTYLSLAKENLYH